MYKKEVNNKHTIQLYIQQWMCNNISQFRFPFRQICFDLLVCRIFIYSIFSLKHLLINLFQSIYCYRSAWQTLFLPCGCNETLGVQHASLLLGSFQAY